MFNASIRGLVAALTLISFSALAQESGNWDGLVEVKPKRLDAAFLLPGADFRTYKKIMMDPVEVAFEKNWVRDYNRDASTLSQQPRPAGPRAHLTGGARRVHGGVHRGLQEGGD